MKRPHARLPVFLRRKPTCSYAEIGLVGGDVVDAVVLAREDDVPVLQEHHPGRQAEVHVRPLVDLVGERHKDPQCKQVAVPGVDMVDLRCRQEAETRWDGARILADAGIVAVRRGQIVIMDLIWKKLFNILLNLAAMLWGGGKDGRRGFLMMP